MFSKTNLGGMEFIEENSISSQNYWKFCEQTEACRNQRGGVEWCCRANLNFDLKDLKTAAANTWCCSSCSPTSCPGPSHCSCIPFSSTTMATTVSVTCSSLARCGFLVILAPYFKFETGLSNQQCLTAKCMCIHVCASECVHVLEHELSFAHTWK